MPTAKLSPKNPLILAALAVGAIYLWNRSRMAGAYAGGIVQPSAAGASLQQQALDAYRNQQVLNVLGGVGSWLGGALQPSVVNEQARAAVRAGDPYYTSGEGQVGGTIPGWVWDQWASDIAAIQNTPGYITPSGDPYNPDGYLLQ